MEAVAEKGPLNLNVAAPGLYASCAKWLKERDIALLGSDVVQDVRPSRVEGVNQPIHQMFLVAVGTPRCSKLRSGSRCGRGGEAPALDLHDDRSSAARSGCDRLAVQSACCVLRAVFKDHEVSHDHRRCSDRVQSA